MRRLIAIPARYGAQRLPAKPLLAETGRPLVRHVHDRAILARGFAGVVVATDDERIATAVRAFGGDVELTRADHATGTERLAELALRRDADIYVNVQGDEPEIEPGYIEQVASLLDDGAAPMATLVCPLPEAHEQDPSVVKCVVSGNRALYFSRALVPHQRDLGGPKPARFQHLGIYAYTKAALGAWPSLPPSPLAQAESLEQLRALEAGWTIRVGVVPTAFPGIDTPADYAAFVARERARALTAAPP